MADVRYWVKNEFGRVWGPFGVQSIGRLDLGTGELEGRISISTDGRNFQPIAEHPDVLKAIEVTRANAPPPRRQVGPADPKPEEPPPSVAPPPVAHVPIPPAPPPEDFSKPPDEGALSEHAVPHLCARVAASGRAGVLRIKAGETAYAIHFKKGTPERVDVPKAAEELAKFLGKRNAAPIAELQKALELSGGPDGELLDALMALNVVPMNDVFRHLGEHATELYGRVLSLTEGTFSWEDGKAPPAGSFAIGQRWSLLCAHARKLPMSAVREQLGGRARSAVYRSGAPLTAIENLALTAQEVRVLATFDGTRSPELIAREMPGESDVALRLALMLSWFNIVSFGPELGAAEPEKAGPVSVDELDAAVEKNTAHGDAKAGAGVGESTLGKVNLKSVAVKVNAPEAKVEPAKVASAKVEPVKVEPAKVEPAKVEPAKVEPAKKPIAPPVAKAVVPPPPKTAPPAAQAAPPAAKVSAPPPARSGAAPPAPAKAARPEPPRAPPPKVAAASYAKAPVSPEQALSEGRALLESWKKANHYQVLGLKPGSSAADIKAAYFALARAHHPDTATGASDELRKLKADLTARINEANSVLGDDQARAVYEQELASGDVEKVDIGPILQAEEDFLRATILVKARKYAEGLALLEQAILMNKEEAEFYAWRGFAKFCLAKDKKAAFDEAMEDCTKAIKMNDNVVQSHFFVGQMSKIVGEMQRAEKAFRRVVELDPKHVDAQRELRLLNARG